MHGVSHWDRLMGMTFGLTHPHVEHEQPVVRHPHWALEDADFREHLARSSNRKKIATLIAKRGEREVVAAG